MDDRVDAVADLADELAVGVGVEVADEMGRECGLVHRYIPSRAAASDRLRDVRSVIRRNVAASISVSDAAACFRTHE